MRRTQLKAYHEIVSLSDQRTLGRRSCIAEKMSLVGSVHVASLNHGVIAG